MSIDTDDRLGAMTGMYCTGVVEWSDGENERVRSKVTGSIYRVDGRGIGQGCQIYQKGLTTTTNQ